MQRKSGYNWRTKLKTKKNQWIELAVFLANKNNSLNTQLIKN